MPGQWECPLLLAFLVSCPLSTVPFGHKEAACPHDHLAVRSQARPGFTLGVRTPLWGGAVGHPFTQSSAQLLAK